jgi:hypothetical protein
MSLDLADELVFVLAAGLEPAVAMEYLLHVVATVGRGCWMKASSGQGHG